MTWPRPPSQISDWWLELVGGPVRGRVVFLLACVLGLNTGDLGTVGAIAGKLEQALSLSNTQLGLLAAMPAAAAAVVTLPMGALTDRSRRIRLLWVTMLLWSALQAVSGFAGSFDTLLLLRVAVGAAAAAALPVVASLVGDLFPSDERGRIWGLILSGELIGSAFGYLVAGESTTLGSGSWRYAFFALAIPSAAIALAVRRWLPEPVRGGASSLARGAHEFVAAEDHAGLEDEPTPDIWPTTPAQELVAERRVPADQGAVLTEDPESMSLWRATRYVLSVRTNLVLIIASSLGYFYFTGVSTFGLVYFQERYHVAHGLATLLIMLLGLGGLAGVIVGGRLADRWLSDGKVNSRIIVGALSFGLAALLFLPGLLSSRLAISLPLFILAGFAFGAREPPLDAARLDIMHHRLWGRAEAARTLLRNTLTAAAPVLFGLIADQLAPPGAHAAANGSHGFGATANAQGLRLALLILLVTLALGGILTVMAVRTYPRDIATAVASEAATSADQEEASTTAATR